MRYNFYRRGIGVFDCKAVLPLRHKDLRKEKNFMKKRICLAIAVCLLVPTVAVNAAAAESSGRQEITKQYAEPTPEPVMREIGDTADKAAVSLAVSDYPGCVKEETYFFHGDEWKIISTVEEKAGVSLDDMELPEAPEGLLEIERVERRFGLPEFYADSDYTVVKRENTKKYLKNGNLVANVTQSYDVWYFESGKVHIYTSCVSLHTAAGYEESYLTEGDVINTDGSVSYTEGYKLTIIGRSYYTEHELGFIVTPSYYKFY